MSLALALAALILNNFLGRVLPASDLANNGAYRAAEQIHQHLSPTDLLVVDDYDWQLTLRYFFGGEPEALSGLKRARGETAAEKEAATVTLRAAIDNALSAGRRVTTLERDAHEMGLVRAARGLALTQAEVEAFYSQYHLERVFQLQGDLGLYWAYQVSLK